MQHLQRTTFALVIGLLAGVGSAQRIGVAGYIGSGGDDQIAGTVVAADGVIVIAGTLDGEPTFRPVRPQVAGEGRGFVARLTGDAKNIQAMVRLPDGVTDLALDANGGLLVTGPSGTRRLNPVTLRTEWQTPIGGRFARVAPGPDGQAVVLADRTVTVIRNGRSRAAWRVTADAAYDVAFDPATELVFVTGYQNKLADDEPLHVAYIYAFQLDGAREWSNYDWSGEDLAERELAGDTRGYRLAMGGDGKLYMAGESTGQRDLFAHHPQSLKRRVQLVVTDEYQSSHTSDARQVAFVGRYEPRTGHMEVGTMLLSRGADDRGQTLRPRALAADSRGRVYLGGACAGEPPISPRALGRHFKGGGAFYTIFDHNFRRLHSAKPATGLVQAITASPRNIVVVGRAFDHLPDRFSPQVRYGGGRSDGMLLILGP